MCFAAASFSLRFMKDIWGLLSWSNLGASFSRSVELPGIQLGVNSTIEEVKLD